jgi:hypothetical protein
VKLMRLNGAGGHIKDKTTGRGSFLDVEGTGYRNCLIFCQRGLSLPHPEPSYITSYYNHRHICNDAIGQFFSDSPSVSVTSERDGLGRYS